MRDGQASYLRVPAEDVLGVRRFIGHDEGHVYRASDRRIHLNDDVGLPGDARQVTELLDHDARRPRHAVKRQLVHDEMHPRRCLAIKHAPLPRYPRGKSASDDLVR